MRFLSATLALVVALLVMLGEPRTALATEPDPTDTARDEYARGNALARATQWGEALGAFEASLRGRPHALTLYNIGVCERVLGRATRARERFRQALLRADADPTELSASLREETQGFVAEYARVLARVAVRLSPADAGLAVDGRPLRERREGDRFVLEAGLEAPGIGKAPSASEFDLEIDPGTHVITVSRTGYRDVVLTRDFAPAQRGTLDLVLARLPGTMHVSASPADALVRVGGIDVGLAPVDVTRPPGIYRISVSRTGYTNFQNDITLSPGEEANVRAHLEVERVPLTKRWWFWASAAAVLATAAVVTYAVTRPTPEPVPYDGGSVGWVVQPR
jgi:PEGA domain